MIRLHRSKPILIHVTQQIRSTPWRHTGQSLHAFPSQTPGRQRLLAPEIRESITERLGVSVLPVQSLPVAERGRYFGFLGVVAATTTTAVDDDEEKDEKKCASGGGDNDVEHVVVTAAAATCRITSQ